MASINVEQKALIDPRFARLGKEMGVPAEWAHDVGMGRSIRAWNECIERGTRVLEEWILREVLGTNCAPILLVTCDLAEQLSDGKFRIKGTKGRVEYLKKLRKNARKNGKKGGRPRKTETGSQENQSRFFEKSSFTSAFTSTSSVPSEQVNSTRGGRPKFEPPTVEQVREFCRERGNSIDAENFIAHYQRQGWVLSNGRAMKDWKSSIITWEKNDASRNGRLGRTGSAQPGRRQTGEDYSDVPDSGKAAEAARKPPADPG